MSVHLYRRRKNRNFKENLVAKKLNLRELDNGELYKCLGQYEDFAVNSPLNKEKIKIEYFTRT